MQQTSERNKIIIYSLLVILVIVAVIFLGRNKQISVNDNILSEEKNATAKIESTAKAGELAINSLRDFIFMTDSKVIDSAVQTLTASSGKSVRVFSAHFTTRTQFKEAYDIYVKGLEAKNYKVDRTEVNGDEATIFAIPTYKLDTGETVVITIKVVDVAQSKVGIFINQPIK